MVMLLVTRWWKKDQIRLCVFFCSLWEAKALSGLAFAWRRPQSRNFIDALRRRQRATRTAKRIESDGRTERKKGKGKGRKKKRRAFLFLVSIPGCGKRETGIMAAKTQGKMVSLQPRSKDEKEQLLMTFSKTS